MSGSFNFKRHGDKQNSAFFEEYLELLLQERDASGLTDKIHDIDAIIQRRVQMIPVMVGRDLHVRLGPGDSVRFVFEGSEYDSLDHVPNMTAQQLIRDSIQEWEDTV